MHSISSNKNLNNVFATTNPLSSPTKGKKKFSRKVLSLAASPTLGDDSGYDLPKSQIYHANHRVILFYLDCVHRYSEAVRSSGEVIDVKTWIGPTMMQGNRSEKENHHGSHSNTGSVRDNLYMEHVRIAKEEEKITPQKEKHFKQIGFTKDEIALIAHPKKDPKTYKALVARVKRFRSFISHSPFEESMNMTVSLPRDSNLMIDKSIENDVRENFLAQTMKKVMQGKVNPVTATRKYINVIRNRLNILSKTIKNFENVFEDVYESILICIKIEGKGTLKKLDAEIYYSNVIKVKEKLFLLKKKSDIVVKFGLTDLKRVVQSLMPRCRKKMKISAFVERTTILWRRLVGFSLNRDSYEQMISVKSRIAQMNKMIAKQKAGTLEPDYQALLNIEAGGRDKKIKDVKKRLSFY